jgi:hypothetical protein
MNEHDLECDHPGFAELAVDMNIQEIAKYKKENKQTAAGLTELERLLKMGIARPNSSTLIPTD